MTTNPADPPVPASPARWQAFAEFERDVMCLALKGLASDILAEAAAGPIAEAERDGAAHTMLAAMRMAVELDELAGRDHPELDVFVSSAWLITDGSLHELNDEVPEIQVHDQREGKVILPGATGWKA